MKPLREIVLETCITKNYTISSRSKNNLSKLGRYSELLETTKEIQTAQDSVRIAALLLGITSTPKCKVCSKSLKLKVTGNIKDNSLSISRTYCSPKCSKKDPEVQEKFKETNLRKYGVENPSQLESIKEKKKKTLLENYGVDNPQKSRVIKEKTQRTNFEKYGVPIPTQSKKVKEKTKSTNKEKYGKNWVTQTELFKEKSGKTNLERYGNKIAAKSEAVKNKTKSVVFEKYGKWPIQSHLRDDALDISSDIEKLKELNKELPCTKIAELLGYSKSHISKIFRENNCEIISHSSYEEEELKQFITTLRVELVTNSRSIISPKELDIYIPSNKVAIEYNGVYWHSYSNQPDKNYHLKKTKACEKQEVQLIHVFSSEWITKKEIVKSVLRSKLGKSLHSIYARKCKLSEVSQQEATIFLNKNHIQGSKNSSVRLGLYQQGELVSLMTFSKRNKKADWELDRFCSKLNTSVVGGASRLLKWFRLSYTGSIITYCDRRYSNGKFYEKLGFELSHISKPNYWYTKDYQFLESRNKYQKHKLTNLLEKVDYSLTEWENMKNHGFDKIYDCGNYVFILNCP